jgi:guanyl-specific ribonuclease Sa
VPPAVPPTPTVAPTTTVTPTVTVPLPAGTPAGTYAAPVTALVGAQRVELNSTANGAAVSVSVPAGALPAGTEVALAAVAHPAALIVQVPAGQSYVVSLAHKGGKKAYRQDSATFLSRRSAGSGQRQLAVTSAGGGAPAQGPSARSGAEVPPGLSPAQT